MERKFYIGKPVHQAQQIYIDIKDYNKINNIECRVNTDFGSVSFYFDYGYRKFIYLEDFTNFRRLYQNKPDSLLMIRENKFFNEYVCVWKKEYNNLNLINLVEFVNSTEFKKLFIRKLTYSGLIHSEFSDELKELKKKIQEKVARQTAYKHIGTVLKENVLMCKDEKSAFKLDLSALTDEDLKYLSDKFKAPVILQETINYVNELSIRYKELEKEISKLYANI